MSITRAETDTEKVGTVKMPARRMLSVLPKLGLVKKPHFHKDGVSFIVPVKDEEEWIKPCLLSIKDVADEIIVVDRSLEDNTPKIIGVSAPQGVRGRNADMALAWKVLGRQPEVSLEEGLARTYRWIANQVAQSAVL
jgi:hypothetical protein